MKIVGMTLLHVFIEKQVEEGALDRFVEEHERLRSKIVQRLEEVQDPVIQQDLNLCVKDLDQLQDGLPTVKTLLTGTDAAEIEGWLTSWREEHDAKVCSIHDLKCWYHHDQKNVAWSVKEVLAGKDTSMLNSQLQSISRLIHAIEHKIHDESICNEIHKDKRDDLLIMWDQSKSLLALLNRMVQPSKSSTKEEDANSGRKKKKRMSRKRIKSRVCITKSATGRNRGYFRKR